MIRIYNSDIKTNELKQVEKISRGCWINMINPTNQEIRQICEETKIKEDFIKYSLDYEEKARTDYEEDDDTTLFIIDIPIIEKENNEEIHSTMPLGMIVVRDDYFITISIKNNRIISELEKKQNKNMITTYKKTRMILQIFYKNAEMYLHELKKINKEKEEAEKELNNSLRNKELLKMLSIEKSLVYFTTSLKSNEVVMEKTLKGKIIKLYEEDEDLLEDAITENKQAIEMTKIYSDILSGTMDAYASIISNNLNVVMKILTAVTLVLSIPTIISGLWGMNVKVPFSELPYGFYIVLGITVIIAIISFIMLRKRNLLS